MVAGSVTFLGCGHLKGEKTGLGVPFLPSKASKFQENVRPLEGNRRRQHISKESSKERLSMAPKARGLPPQTEARVSVGRPGKQG